MDLHLAADGPHSDDYTREVAVGFAETVRILNYATRTSDGMPEPATLNSVLNYLSTGMHRMDQLLGQLDDRLRAMAVENRIGDTRSDPFQVVAQVRRQFELLRTDAAVMAERLDRAFNATSGLYLRDESEA